MNLIEPRPTTSRPSVAVAATVFAAAAVLSVMFLGGCARSADPAGGAQSADPAGAAHGADPAGHAPPSLSVLLGQTGARGGQMQGIRIGADGAVTAWRGRAAGQNPVDRGFISESEGDSLWAWIQEAAFFQEARQYPGNQTRFMAVTVADSTRRATWPVGPGAPAPGGAIPALFDRIMALVDGDY